MDVIFAGIAGLVCGILSGFGIGGGSLLMVWMTAVIGMKPSKAGCINLLYFLPTSLGALIFHWKHKMIAWKAVLFAVLFGLLTAALGAWLSSSIEEGLLRKLFGGFLLVVGFLELKKK